MIERAQASLFSFIIYMDLCIILYVRNDKHVGRITKAYLISQVCSKLVLGWMKDWQDQQVSFT